MANLPNQEIRKGSSEDTKQFFDTFFAEPLSYPAAEIDAVVGYFEGRGFGKEAAISVAKVLIRQAKLDGIKVFKLVDTLKGLNKVQLSSVVTEILNYNRPKSSTLGYRIEDSVLWGEKRNIVV